MFIMRTSENEDGIQALRTLIADTSNAVAWFNMGVALSDTEVALVVGTKCSKKEYSKRECFAKAVELDAKYAVAFYKLGNAMHPDETITVGAETLTAKQCYIKALDINENIPGLWYNLATFMTLGEVLTIGGAEYQQYHCLLKVDSLEMNVKDANAWANIAFRMVMPGDTITVGGDTFNQKQCYDMALKIDPKNATALSSKK